MEAVLYKFNFSSYTIYEKPPACLQTETTSRNTCWSHKSLFEMRNALLVRKPFLEMYLRQICHLEVWKHTSIETKLNSRYVPAVDLRSPP